MIGKFIISLIAIGVTIWWVIAIVKQIAAEKAVEMRQDYQMDVAFYPQTETTTSVCITLWYMGSYIKYTSEVATDTKDEMVKVVLKQMLKSFENVRISRDEC